MSVTVNLEHLKYCSGPEWAALVREFVVPWATGGVNLGDHLLEVGPGPGATTDVLRLRVPRLTAAEVDRELAVQLREHLSGGNVSVVQADGTELPFRDGRFSSAICLTMLHHVAGAVLQDRLFGELARVVRPGGFVVGSDSLDSPELRAFHAGDTFAPIDPAGLPRRLARAGLRDVRVETNDYAYRFIAVAP